MPAEATFPSSPARRARRQPRPLPVPCRASRTSPPWPPPPRPAGTKADEITSTPEYAAKVLPSGKTMCRTIAAAAVDRSADGARRVEDESVFAVCRPGEVFDAGKLTLATLPLFAPEIVQVVSAEGPERVLLPAPPSKDTGTGRPPVRSSERTSSRSLPTTRTTLTLSSATESTTSVPSTDSTRSAEPLPKRKV